MKCPPQGESFVYRHWLVVGVLSLGVLSLLARMIQLTVFDSDFLQHQGNARTVRIIDIPALRGMLTDRNGAPLAVTTPVSSVWINPQQFLASESDLAKLAKILNDDAKILQKRLKENTKKEFIYLKRRIPPPVGDKVLALKIPGVYIKREYRRYYPAGEVSAHVVGITNIDDIGIEGEELIYNDALQGMPGKEKVLKDGLGHVVSVVKKIRPEHPGKTIALSIDKRIQYLAYRELKKTVAENNAESGSIVVLNVKTGEVLAMVNVPSFNPNVPRDGIHSRYRNRAVTDVFEPGSTIKAFTVANALETGQYMPDTQVDTTPGWMYLNGHRVHDPINYGPLTVTQILQHSSNIGVTKLTLSTLPDSLWQLLHKLGFGLETDSHFPGEVAGSLAYHRRWSPFTLATLSFGYGLSVTNLQLAQAYAILAAGGVKHPVSLIKLTHPKPSQRIVSQTAAEQIIAMLEKVVAKGGTATRAGIPGYRVSGKTGTVRIVGPKGYEKDHHISMFVGTAPVSDPNMVVSVVIRDPKAGKYYGGLVAAPVFRQVMGGALRILGIKPDNVPIVNHEAA